MDQQRLIFGGKQLEDGMSTPSHVAAWMGDLAGFALDDDGKARHDAPSGPLGVSALSPTGKQRPDTCVTCSCL